MVVLLGIGEGVFNGVCRTFSRYAQHTIECWGGSHPGGNPILFTMPLLKQLQCNVEDMRYITPVLHSHCNLRYKGKHRKGVVITADSCYHRIAQLVLAKGRFLNDRDALFVQPVCVIDDTLRSSLFEKEEPVGKFINVAGTYLQVVGTLAKDSLFNYEDRDCVFILRQTLARIYNANILDQVYCFKILLQLGRDAVSIERKICAYLAGQLSV